MVTESDAAADAVLLELIRDRDEAALGMLYDRHARLLYSLIRRIVGDLTDAEEVTQDAFVRIWEQAATFDRSRGTALGWMVAIARRLAIDKTRSRSYSARSKEVELTDGHHNPGHNASATQEDALIAKEERVTVGSALSALDAQHRDVINLAYFEGLSHSGIAERLQIPLGTVKTRIRSAMKILRDQLRTHREQDS
ncbi:MAG: sigma-70 family RNA polymerase sigma factor [Candidatus Zixiibacteriota bacterium]